MTEKDGERNVKELLCDFVKHPKYTELAKVIQTLEAKNAELEKESETLLVNIEFEQKRSDKFHDEMHELRTRVAELEMQIEHPAIGYKQEVIALKRELAPLKREHEELQNRLSTLEKSGKEDFRCIDAWRAKYCALLKASEGMEKALEDMIILAMPELSVEHKQVEEAKQALADFRALKETK